MATELELSALARTGYTRIPHPVLAPEDYSYFRSTMALIDREQRATRVRALLLERGPMQVHQIAKAVHLTQCRTRDLLTWAESAELVVRSGREWRAA